MPVRSFLEVTLLVRDIDASAAFYCAMGIPVFVVDQPGYTRHYDGHVGDTVLQLWPASSHPPTRTQLGFRVANVAEIAESLDLLGFSYELPHPNRLAARDPDGNRVHVSQVPAPPEP